MAMAIHGGDINGGAAASLLDHGGFPKQRLISTWIILLFLAGVSFLLFLVVFSHGGEERRLYKGLSDEVESVEAEHGVVAADDGRCSAIGVAALRAGGHAVDAAVAAALCLGVVNPMSSGIGGGAFIVVRSAKSGKAHAFDARETAPLAASQSMYESDPSSKSKGPLAMGVPGELAGLYAAWTRHGRLPWKDLVWPAIVLARDGFTVSPYLAAGIQKKEADILADAGLRRLFLRRGRLLRAGDTARNPALAGTLAAVADGGAPAFYAGAAGVSLADDVRAAGGLLTPDDLRSYKVSVSDAVAVDAFGYTVVGMPPPSSGTVGLAMVLKILEGYEEQDGEASLHRLVEALKHLLAKRMELGDPAFVDVASAVSDMVSSTFAAEIRRRINDDETFGPEYYLPKWRQIEDEGTSHLCVVDAERNAVSMTSTVNSFFGAGVLSPSTGVVLNNEMDDFSVPVDASVDRLPPSPANFIEPRKRPLSSMTPIIVLKGDQLAGILGASGGTNIISAVAQVFINHFVLGMSSEEAVKHPRVYHKLIPNLIQYENLTTSDGEHIELAMAARALLGQRGHVLSPVGVAAVCQLIVHDLQNPISTSMRKMIAHGQVFRGMLTAVSDPRKGGRPAGV
ncbi:glutathione hydrolase 3-like [Wolffia australiana]